MLIEITLPSNIQEISDPLKRGYLFGVRRQSEAATALWLGSPFPDIQSVVALP
jgi:hypothetical protein